MRAKSVLFRPLKLLLLLASFTLLIQTINAEENGTDVNDTITATASLLKGSYTLGQPVPLEIAVTNHGQKSVYTYVDESGFLELSVTVEDVNGIKVEHGPIASPPPPPRHWWITIDGRKIFTHPVVEIEPGQTTKLAIQDALNLYHDYLQEGIYYLIPRELPVMHEVGFVIIREDQEHKLWIDPYTVISRGRYKINYEVNNVKITLYEGKIIYVDDDGPADFSTIQAAIDDADDGETVVVAPGTYTGDGNRDIDFKGKSITVKSENGPQTCIIDCQGTEDDPHRGFIFASGETENSILQGFSIVGGIVADKGGAIQCDNASSPTILNCNIARNESIRYGGGIYCGSNCNPLISECLIEGNTAEYGAGVNSYEFSSLTIQKCIIQLNTALKSGGAINATGFWQQQGLVVIDCEINNNQAKYGGAIFCGDPGIIVSNSILNGNFATYSGGAILCSTGGHSFTNCTIVNNTANITGGAFHGEGNSYNGEVLFENCIIWDNSAPVGDAISRSKCGHQAGCPLVKIIYCCLPIDNDALAPGARYGWYIDVEKSVFSLNPRFIDSHSGDFRLNPDSPCIDAGTDATSIQLPIADIEGNPRNVDGDRDGSILPDIGAYELPAPNQPYIWFSPPQLEFVADFGGPNPTPQIFTIQNLGLRKLDWTIQYNSEWLDVFPDPRSYKPHTTNVGITIDLSSLQHGSYTCDITISDPNALNHPQIVPVVLHVTKPLYVPKEFPTIQSAINASVPYDTIIVADGIYEGPGNHDITFRGKPITVRSENGPQNCIINSRNGNDSNSVFVFNSEEDKRAILDGFTIVTNNWQEAILCDESSPTIRNCQITGDGDVVGIDLTWSNSVIENCFIESCYYAIRCNNSDAVISDCVVRDNDSGLFLVGFSPQLYRCDISMNKREAIEMACRGTYIMACTLTQNGNDNRFIPAIICGGSSFVLERCIISGNNSSGLLIYDCPNAVVRNCIISGNGKYDSAAGYGIRSIASNILVDNSTIAGNAGDGFRCNGNQSGRLPPGMNMLLTNSILWGNEPNQVGGNTDLLSVTHTNVQDGWPGEGNIDVEPCFANPGYWTDLNDPNAVWVDGDYHLKSQAGRWDPASESWIQDDVTSPCIDVGDPNMPVSDEPEPNGGRINMGAYGGTPQASKSTRP